MFFLKRGLVIVAIVYIVICVIFALLNALSVIKSRRDHGVIALNGGGGFGGIFISNLAVSLLTTPIGGYIHGKWLEKRR